MARPATVLMRDAATSAMSWQLFGPQTAAPVVLCHGMGLDRDNMRGLADVLARGRRVLVWDMPGHGGLAAATDCSARAMAGHCLAVMDAAGITTADFIGFSFGGIVAQIIAAEQPARVRSLVAYGCFAPFHQAPPLKPWQRIALLTAWRLQSWPQIRHAFAHACATTAEGRADVLRAMDSTAKPVFLAMSAALFNSFVPRQDVRFSMPLMLLRGAQDANAAALDIAWDALRQMQPGLTETIIADAGHCAHNDRPEQAASAIAAFLDRVDAA